MGIEDALLSSGDTLLAVAVVLLPGYLILFMLFHPKKSQFSERIFGPEKQWENFDFLDKIIWSFFFSMVWFLFFAAVFKTDAGIDYWGVVAISWVLLFAGAAYRFRIINLGIIDKCLDGLGALFEQGKQRSTSWGKIGGKKERFIRAGISKISNYFLDIIHLGIVLGILGLLIVVSIYLFKQVIQYIYPGLQNLLTNL
jgi:hypothetical protein